MSVKIVAMASNRFRRHQDLGISVNSQFSKDVLLRSQICTLANLQNLMRLVYTEATTARSKANLGWNVDRIETGVSLGRDNQAKIRT
jgi:hypothetical protein